MTEAEAEAAATKLRPRRLVEDGLAIMVLAVMTLMPVAELVGRRWLGGGIPGSFPIVQHLTLWATFVGATLAARSDRLLALSLTRFLPERWRDRAALVASTLAVAITALLTVASFELFRIDYEYGDRVAWGIPVWAFSAIMPLGFAAITARLIERASTRLRGRLVAAAGLLVPVLFGLYPELVSVELLVPAGVVILIGTALGMPIYTAIGGLALLLFWADGTPIAAVPGETYRLSTSPMLPALPLFTVGGYILAEGGSGQRLMRFFSAVVGWLPGGVAVMTTVVLAFFTPLTGASGITILSMGGILLPGLLKANYPERTSVGLVTVSGSIGLLLPPSLPVILYAFYAELPIERLFVAGLLPGLLLITVVAGWGAYRGWSKGAERTPFRAREAAAATWHAKWELLLPVVILWCIFGGYATLVEAAAITVLYSLVLQCFISRDLGLVSDMPRVLIESATMVGGFMIILGVALGLTNYLITVQVPMQALAWVQAHIASTLMFLLALNLLLIIVGALMDIYSAILVIVPLIAPMAAAYDIDPIHLGIIFLANMELGYLMPPMGENLFMSAYRFDKPLTAVYRATLPYVLILLVTVLLITYVPGMTLWLVELLGV